MRGRPRRCGARRGRGRVPEQDPRRAHHVEGRGDAAAERAGEARRARRLLRPRGARRAAGGRVGDVQRRPRSELLAKGEALEAELTGERRERRAQRGGEADLAARARADARGRERGRRRALGASCASAGSTGCSAPTARTSPRRSTAGTCAGSRRCSRRTRRSGRRGLHGHAAQARLRHGERREHPPRPRRPPAEVAAGVRDRVRPAEGRPPDHARAGRAARLPGVPARGRSRAALRRLRPVAAVRVPPALARPRADGDLLVHPRGDHARARLARAPTSA